MKKLFPAFAAAVLFAAALPAARAQTAMTLDFFYTSLEPHGEWLEVADYGYVWHPRDAAAEWRPYTDGHWVFTDAGWTWVSEEPFGWAVYHYGRWIELEPVGWVWVPDVEWGPAWVSWRRSPQHVGWAPLPPEARFRRTVGIHAWADSYYDIGPAHYSFVEVRNFGAPRLREVVLPPRQNVTIITQTTNITNITYQNTVVYNAGPEYDVIVRESSQPIRRLRLDRRQDFASEGGVVRQDRVRNRIEGEVLQVVAPAINVTGAAAPAPARVARKVERARVNRGWRDIADQGQVKQLRAKMKSEAKVPEALPPEPQFEPVTARAAEPGDAPAAAATDAPTTQPGRARDTANPAGAKPGERMPATTRKPGSLTAPSDQPAASAETPLPPDNAKEKTRPGAPGRKPADSASPDPESKSPKPGADEKETPARTAPGKGGAAKRDAEKRDDAKAKRDAAKGDDAKARGAKKDDAKKDSEKGDASKRDAAAESEIKAKEAISSEAEKAKAVSQPRGVRRAIPPGAAKPAERATPAVPATPAETPGSAAPAEPATPAIPATPAKPRVPKRDDDAAAQSDAAPKVVPARPAQGRDAAERASRRAAAPARGDSAARPDRAAPPAPARPAGADRPGRPGRPASAQPVDEEAEEAARKAKARARGAAAE